jgi:hypothetical protein
MLILLTFQSFAFEVKNCNFKSIFEGMQFQELYQNKYVAICEQTYKKN